MEFEIIGYDEYMDYFVVDIHDDKGNVESMNLPAVYDPEFTKEVEERGDYMEVYEEWEEAKRDPILGFEYKEKTIYLKDIL